MVMIFSSHSFPYLSFPMKCDDDIVIEICGDYVYSAHDFPQSEYLSPIFGHQIIHFPTSFGVIEWANERMSTAERTSEASSAEQANEWAVRAFEQTDNGPVLTSRILAYLIHCVLSFSASLCYFKIRLCVSAHEAF